MQTKKRTPTIKNEGVFNKIKLRFSKSTAGQHTIHILSCLKYMLVILIAGIVISTAWNAVMNAWFQGKYQISMFEAAILWACLY